MGPARELFAVVVALTAALQGTERVMVVAADGLAGDGGAAAAPGGAGEGEEASCCWCGKRYLPKEGYYEGQKQKQGAAGSGSGSGDASARAGVDAQRTVHAQREERADSRPRMSAVHRESFVPAWVRVRHTPLACVPGVVALGIPHTPVATSNTIQPAERPLVELSNPKARGTPWFPFGFFASWGGWLGRDVALLDRTVGTIVTPVSPFDPVRAEEAGGDGGEEGEGVEAFLAASGARGVAWNYDLKHVYRDPRALHDEVVRVRDFDGVFGWYLADEPDGAGTVEGDPVGVNPAQVRSAYRMVKFLDPQQRPVLVALNCMHSAPFYEDAADILLVDPYPISIDAAPCSPGFGCCGCDDCAGDVTDVAVRLDHVAHLLRNKSKPIWLVAQAFGGEGHWARAPSPAELRCMTYLGLAHGASGILYWLRTETDSALVAEASRLADEVQHIARIWSHPDTVEVAVIAPSPATSVDRLDMYAVMLATADGTAAAHDAMSSDECAVSETTAATMLALLVTNTAKEERTGPLEVKWGSGFEGCYTGDATVRFESTQLGDASAPTRRVPVANGVLRDSDPLPAYGTRLYEIHLDEDAMLSTMKCIKGQTPRTPTQ